MSHQLKGDHLNSIFYSSLSLINVYSVDILPVSVPLSLRPVIIQLWHEPPVFFTAHTLAGRWWGWKSGSSPALVPSATRIALAVSPLLDLTCWSHCPPLHVLLPVNVATSATGATRSGEHSNTNFLSLPYLTTPYQYQFNCRWIYHTTQYSAVDDLNIYHHWSYPI